MFITDRSRLESFLTCPEKRHILYTLNRAPEPGPDLTFGIAFHEAIAALVHGLSWTEAWHLFLEHGGANLPVSWQVTGRGLIHAAIHTVEQLHQTYEVISVEHEEEPIQLDPQLSIRARYDVVVRRRADNIPFVVNWKTTGNLKRFHYFAETNIQPLIEAVGLSVKLGEPAGLLLIGFTKGRKEQGELINPFTRYWQNRDTGERSVTQIRRKGWYKCMTTLDHVPNHIQWLPEQAFREAVAHPIASIPTAERRQFLIDEAIRIEAAAAAGMRWHNWTQCRTILGECFASECCHEGLDPVDLFPPREPNHPED